MSLYGLFYGGTRHESEHQRNPQGISLFFSVIKWHWGRLIGLNLLILVCCLPIVTIPATMAAASRVLGLMLRRRVCYLWHDYWSTFAREWKRASLAGWFNIAVMLAAILGMWFYPRTMGGVVGMALAAVCCVVVVIAVMSMMMLYPMVVFTDLPVRGILKNAVLLVFVRLPQSLAGCAAIFAVLTMSYLGLPYTVAIMPCFGFSLIGLIGTYIGWGGVSRHVISLKQTDDANGGGEADNTRRYENERKR